MRQLANAAQGTHRRRTSPSLQPSAGQVSARPRCRRFCTACQGRTGAQVFYSLLCLGVCAGVGQEDHSWTQQLATAAQGTPLQAHQPFTSPLFGPGKCTPVLSPFLHCVPG